MLIQSFRGKKRLELADTEPREVCLCVSLEPSSVTLECLLTKTSICKPFFTFHLRIYLQECKIGFIEISGLVPNFIFY